MARPTKVAPVSQPEGLKPSVESGAMSPNVLVFDEDYLGRPCITLRVFTDIVVGEAGESFTIETKDAEGKVTSSKVVQRRNPLVARIKAFFGSGALFPTVSNFPHGARIELNVSENVPKAPGQKAAPTAPWVKATRAR